jgi:3-methylcrotonyl-CoA carboxylase alpha subunit
LKRCVVHPAFIKGRVETGFIPEYITSLNPPAIVATPTLDFTAAAVFSQLLAEADAAADRVAPEDEDTPWATNSNFRLNMAEERHVVLGVKGDEKMQINVTVVHLGAEDYLMTFADGSSRRVTGFEHGDGEVEADEGLLQMTMGDVTYKARVLEDEDELHVYINGNCTVFTLPTIEYGEIAGKGGDGCVAPMAGKVVKVMVAAGDTIKQGQPLLIMEAMKMEHVIKAPRAAVVVRVPFAAGDFVEGGKVVVTFEKEEEEE